LRDLAVRDLIKKNERPAIVFCSSRPGTEKLARYLRESLNDKEIKFYHAGLSREEKTNVEKWYFSSDVGVLVATCAYGMGVDKANIRTVVHRDCPPSVEAYLQESGRAGRDGKFSRAFLLWGQDDERSLARAKTDYDKRRLRGLFEYARDTKNCRREKLLEMLNYASDGQKPETECCDVCASKAQAQMREEETLLQFFRKNRRAWTESEAAKILADCEAISWTQHDAKRAIANLIKAGKIKKYKSYLWKDKIG
jgi:ATP-dependent DNA helicase RecQ